MKAASAREGFDDVQVVEYWFTNGGYAVATLAGRHDDHYGTSWELTNLCLRWKDGVLGLPTAEKKIELRLDAIQLIAIGLTSYLRSHLRDHEGQSSFAQAQAHLGEAETRSNAMIAALAAPIHAAYERQQVWIETLAAHQQGREFSWFPPETETKFSDDDLPSISK